MESEKKIFDLMDEKNKVMSKYWMPLVWATNIINRARKESLISSDHLVQTILTELSDIRRRLGSLIGYDTVCLPLVYTQVTFFFFKFIIFMIYAGDSFIIRIAFFYICVIFIAFYIETRIHLIIAHLDEDLYSVVFQQCKIIYFQKV